MIGPIARGVRTMWRIPSRELDPHPAELVAEELGRLRAADGAAGRCGSSTRSPEATSHAAAATVTIAALPNASETSPPAKTPTSSATVPPTVATEFAARRSSVGTSRGTTACAVARKNRFTEVTHSAPA